MKKAQSGMDFLMTYGWALLVVVIVVGALFGLGIFDEGTFVGNKVVGFQSIGVMGWQLQSSGTLNLKLRNNVGTDVEITAIEITKGERNHTETLSTSLPISNGKTATLNVNVGTNLGTLTAGQTYSIQVTLTYRDTKNNYVYVDKGTITGKVV